MPSNVAVAFARVCDRTVTKGIRFVPSLAGSPDRDLGEARAALDRGDGRAALKSLGRARRGYVKRRDRDGLDHVLDMTKLVDPTDDRVRVERENLVYAVKQNLRQESRRSAQERAEPWLDPYPDLQAPTEHTGVVLTRGVKLAIGVGVLVAVAAAVGIVIAVAVTDTSTTTVTVRLANDTGRTLDVRACDDIDCVSSFAHSTVKPSGEADSQVDPDTLVQLYRIGLPGPDECLPLRIHDAYQTLAPGRTLLARLSQATPCPGTTVLPRAAGPIPSQL
jgi:hypothetical protein